MDKRLKGDRVAFPVFVLLQSLNVSLLFWWIDRRARTRDRDRREALDLSLLLAIAGLIGARLLHVFWEAPEHYAQNPARIFDLTAGGFVYYGGLLAAAAAGLVFVRAHGQDAGPWFDFFAPVVSLGTAIGRAGCLWAGCCYGKVCSLPWAMTVLDEQGLRLPRHPAPLYAILGESAILTVLLGLERRSPSRRPRWLRRPGSLFASWLALHAALRFVIEFFRADFRGPRIAGFSLGQAVSLTLLAGALLFLARASRSETAT